MLVGSWISVRFRSNERDQKSWGIRLIVKPIIGKPKLIYKDLSHTADRETEILLNSTTTNLQGQTMSSPSWLNILNRIVFLYSFMTRGLLDTNLIEQQTDGLLSYDSGIYKNFGAD